jgi:hypothetical protein
MYHTLTAQCVQALEAFCLFQSKIPISFNVKAVQTLEHFMGSEELGEVIDVLVHGRWDCARQALGNWMDNLQNIVPNQHLCAEVQNSKTVITRATGN